MSTNGKALSLLLVYGSTELNFTSPIQKIYLAKHYETYKKAWDSVILLYTFKWVTVLCLHMNIKVMHHHCPRAPPRWTWFLRGGSHWSVTGKCQAPCPSANCAPSLCSQIPWYSCKPSENDFPDTFHTLSTMSYRDKWHGEYGLTYFSLHTDCKCFLINSRIESNHNQKLKFFPGIFSWKNVWMKKWENVKCSSRKAHLLSH